MSYLFLALSICAIAYAVVALARMLAFRARLEAYEKGRINALPTLPPITVLKPVAGLETGLYENLCSFCAQDYPQFQVVFGIPNPDDPAAAVIADVARAFPGRAIALVTGRAAPAQNLKVAQLMEMVKSAAHGLLVVADSDTRVEPAYLRAVATAFANADVGAVTCLYRGAPRSGIASALGALMIDDQFIPSVLVAAGGGVRFCLGATMAVTRRALDAIGGFAALSDYLADDQMLGELVSRAGLRVELAPYVVEHIVDEPSLRTLWSHELRWARTSRAARPWGYTGYFITFVWPPALVYLLVAGSTTLALAVLGAAVALRVASHYASRAGLRARGRDLLWLVPMRDLMGLAVWACSFFGRGVRWRDRALRIDGQGRIVDSMPERPHASATQTARDETEARR
ncbi:MAG TPA: bacteriohopanetetrol glucosamine biosynthesis glycosyltransferase HpnI [Candidatus Eremiobacteraceae bacterium]|nr:bacteriohopanetetrol glucosamine biosynthesis glycosyltransferase HpnI [Candidatus Eremiobacteraceae bacterium]